jgi:hypothetical protein
MSTRTRSQSRERVIRRSDVFPSGEELDPHELLAGLLVHFKNVDVPLSVNLTDGENRVAFSLQVFLSKKYEVDGGMVKLGFKRLKVDKLEASIRYDVKLDDG